MAELFHQRNLLDRVLCADLCREMLATQGHPAMVATDADSHVDEAIRRTTQKQPRSEIITVVSECLSAVRPAIERVFGVHVSPPGMPRFLCYRAGDYFRKHVDTTNVGEISSEIASRLVSAVIFLNEPRAPGGEGDYTGGQLVLYNIPGLGRRTVIAPEPGLLVAFRSSTLHEVTRIRSGIRMTAVSWFHKVADSEP